MRKSIELRMIRDELSEKLNNLAGKEDLSDEQRAEMSKLDEQLKENRLKLSAAQHSEAIADEKAEAQARESDTGEDAEARELRKLREKASLGRSFAAAIEGRADDGADREFRQAVNVSAGQIPLELFEPTETEKRADVATTPPGTVGVNLTRLVPAVFARSIATKLGIEMPRAPSGTYAVPRITTNLTAGAVAKGAAQESTKAAFTVTTVKPRRVSASMSLRAEDLAEVGIPGFEGSLRSNLQMVLAAALDNQVINGDGTAPNITGLIASLTDPTNPSAVATFQSVMATMADQIDGLFASMLDDVALCVNPATARLFNKTLMSPEGTKGQGYSHPEPTTIADWLGSKLGAFSSNARMPAASSNIAKAIVAKRGMAATPQPTMPAVLPSWGAISIDDRYSDAASATEHVRLHVLIGDTVVLRHPDAFAQVEFKLA